MSERMYTAAWQELFQQADAGARTSPASAGSGADGGGGGKDLQHSGRPWTRAAGAAEDLRLSVTTARSRLTGAHDGIAAAGAGLGSLGVLRTVLASWEARLGAVGSECGDLAPKLRLVAKDQGEQEIKVKTSFEGRDRPTGDEPGK
ncbi:hypothetical protein ACGFZH_37835 [Streptomyces zaomyceticus]|uniref:hypothetical protein n=1 Tax=Streptomyces zaomyceticus TaxID=68286 RepID=UPI00372442FF